MTLNVDYKGRALFLDGDVDVVRYDVIEYPMLDKIIKQQKSYFWQPSEIQDLIKDKNDFSTLSAHEKHIFTSNIKRQILLDSIQGSAPAEVFGPISSVPEAQLWATRWTESETVHSESYTHIIRNIYPNPQDVVDDLPNIEQIVDCGVDIGRYYDELDKFTKWVNLFGYYQGDSDYPDAFEPVGYASESINKTHHKRLLLKCLMSVNILEGIRFYVSFACSWAFAERRLMEGNAKIIKLIARDENLHLASTQFMIRELRRKDPEFQKIFEQDLLLYLDMFDDAAKQEKSWAQYLFRDGSMVGLTEPILVQYVDYITKQRLKAVDLPHDHIEITQNPLPWTQKWIAGKDVQDAPQEVSKTEYRIGGVKSDLGSINLKGFKL